MNKLVKIKSLRPILRWILAIPTLAIKHLKNEMIFIVGIISSLIFVKLQSYLGDSSLWISLLILTVSAFYYSYTFFSSDQKIEKLYYLEIKGVVTNIFCTMKKIKGTEGLENEKTGQN